MRMLLGAKKDLWKSFMNDGRKIMKAAIMTKQSTNTNELVTKEASAH